MVEWWKKGDLKVFFKFFILNGYFLTEKHCTYYGVDRDTLKYEYIMECLDQANLHLHYFMHLFICGEITLYH